ncbi:MAG: HAMP domain-containing methyl-accepting chemotaxis protein [Desulfovibrio sp.]|nr:HAMP domain-containing methyl-accepting chemotaxis protein [Desulfovibrio sp.]
MIKSAEDTEAKLEQLVKSMADSLRTYIENGNQSASLQYAQNIADTVAVYTRVGNVLEEMLIAERNENMEEFARVRKELPGIAADMQKIYGNLMRPEGREIFTQTMKSYETMSQEAERLAQAQVENARAGKERVEFYQQMYAESLRMQEVTTTNSTKLVNEAEASLSSATTLVIIILAIVLILGVAVAIFITRMIVKPLSVTQQFAEGVAGGDLNRSLEVHTTDETGKLADALRAMVSALKSNISEAQQKSAQAQKATEEATQAMAKAEEAARRAESAKRDGMLAAASQLEGMVEIISSASTQLSAQIEQSDRGASESAQRLQEAATAMNEMNATVQEVARNAGSASAASSDTKQKAEAGEHVVQQVVQSIGEVQQVSLQLKDDMAQLNERAQDINRIMGVISDIADQTNLLALNAAIEAARAGEAGRGFAVVADEVRKLAEKTMTSTLDVSNAIRAIQESTDKSMGAVDNAVSRISEATELANQSGAALEEIVATVEATSDQVQAIAAASEEQSAASEEINRSIIEVNDMSRLTADAMAEATQAVSDLANQAHKLTDLIQEMKNS